MGLNKLDGRFVLPTAHNTYLDSGTEATTTTMPSDKEQIIRELGEMCLDKRTPRPFVAEAKFWPI